MWRRANYVTDCRINGQRSEYRPSHLYCLQHVSGVRVRLALFEPDIPQNAGALLRLAACFGVAVDLIEPCGFLLDDRRLQRAALDYAADLVLCRHFSWLAFLPPPASPPPFILITPTPPPPLPPFTFPAD